jgi:arylsulfatase A-like enzyme
LTAFAATAIGSERPNIVLLLADDLGWTGVGCFGSDFYETPNIDTLSRQGMKFTNSYAACTVCSPTRASIMTGMYPARLRLTDFIAGQNRPFAKMKIPDWTKELVSERVTMAELLKKQGYKTAHIGKWHLSPRGNRSAGMQPMDQGFDISYDGPPGRKGYFLKKGSSSQTGSNYLTDVLTDKACQFIDESAGEPFFLYFAYHVPHTPIQGRNDLVQYFEARVDKKLTHNNPVYAAMVKSLDQSVGRIMGSLQKHGLTENTLVIFTSDNGGLTQRYGKHDGFTENLPLRRGKGSAYEGGVRVPTIVRWPNGIIGGTVCDTPIMTIDYLPTLLEVTNAAPAQNENDVMDGQSLVSLFRNPKSQLNRDLFWHYPHYHAGGDGPYSAIRSGDYRLIESHEDNRMELYNLATDLGEQNDLHDQMPEKVNELKQKLAQWRTNVQAQMPTPNPDFDPDRQTKVVK